MYQKKKVTHFLRLFSRCVADEKYIVAGEISVDNAICMEKCEGHCDVVSDVDLNVVRDLLSGRFQKVSQAVVHELHQKNWETSVGICVATYPGIVRHWGALLGLEIDTPAQTS